MRYDPSYGTIHDLCLHVNSLDGDKGFDDAGGHGTVGSPGGRERLGPARDFGTDASFAGECRKEVEKTERIVEIGQGVDESGIPFLDEMVQRVGRCECILASGLVRFVPSGRLADLFHEGLEGTEFFQEGFVCQGAYVLDVVVGLSLLFLRRSIARFTGIDALEDAQTSKVLERYLESLQTGRSTDECRIQSCMVPLLDLTHT
mmetsp:Transcript_17820/g.25182  ORF Transcript_17820/g.25182 Transcript_17820/m.25182 type:complete len:203 (-) Transcript_17820:191-799(-)